MAFGPFLQYDYDPSQVLSPDSLHPSLPSPSLPLGYLHHNGLSHYHRPMDDPKWLFLLRPYPRLLESVCRGPRDEMSTLRPCVVYQCGTPDDYRHSDIDFAHAAVMEATTTE